MGLTGTHQRGTEHEVLSAKEQTHKSQAFDQPDKRIRDDAISGGDTWNRATTPNSTVVGALCARSYERNTIFSRAGFVCPGCGRDAVAPSVSSVHAAGTTSSSHCELPVSTIESGGNGVGCRIRMNDSGWIDRIGSCKRANVGGSSEVEPAEKEDSKRKRPYIYGTSYTSVGVIVDTCDWKRHRLTSGSTKAPAGRRHDMRL